MIFYAHVDHVIRKEGYADKVSYELWQIEADDENDCHNIISENNGLLCGYMRIDKAIWKVRWKETSPLEERE